MYPSSSYYGIYSHPHWQEYNSSSQQSDNSEDVEQLRFNLNCHTTISGSGSPKRLTVADSTHAFSWNNHMPYAYPNVPNAIFPDSDTVDIRFQPHEYMNVLDNCVLYKPNNHPVALKNNALGSADSRAGTWSIASASTSGSDSYASSSPTPNPMVDPFIHRIINLRTVSPEFVPQLFGQISQGFHCKLLNCSCPYKTFPSVAAVMDHIRTEDLPQCKPKAVWCNCNKWLSSPSVGKRHADTHNEGGKYKCPNCTRRFKRKDEILTHVRARHSKDLKL